MRTLVLGGGHETFAFGHGAGCWTRLRGKRKGIVILMRIWISVRPTGQHRDAVSSTGAASHATRQARVSLCLLFRRERAGEYAGVVAGSAVAECYRGGGLDCHDALAQVSAVYRQGG